MWLESRLTRLTMSVVEELLEERSGNCTSVLASLGCVRESSQATVPGVEGDGGARRDFRPLPKLVARKGAEGVSFFASEVRPSRATE